jgi:putative photosynthetic complex assembly protein 2
MHSFGYPALYALFVWWFSTGLIIYLDNLSPRTFRWSMLGGTLVFATSLYRLAASSTDTSTAGAYAAFTYGVLIWGWQEMSFFMGYITGPRKTAVPLGCRAWRRFVHGVEMCLHHELTIIATALAVVDLTWGAPNQVGTWTFLLLWGMRQSAKLNFFLGVRNLGEEFVPKHLGYMKGLMARKPINLLFPFSVTLGTVIAVLLAQRAMVPGISGARAAGLTFLFTMMVLAVVEHWFLVLPLPFAELWSWVLRFRGDERRLVAADLAVEGAARDPRHDLAGVARPGLAVTTGGQIVALQ